MEESVLIDKIVKHHIMEEENFSDYINPAKQSNLGKLENIFPVHIINKINPVQPILRTDLLGDLAKIEVIQLKLPVGLIIQIKMLPTLKLNS